MVYPVHYLLSYGGTFISDPTEIWANNIRFARNDAIDAFGSWGETPSNYSAMLDSFTATITAHMANADSGYSANDVLKYVKFNRIDSAGHYESETESHTKFISGVATTGAGAGFGPLSLACVVTFLTGQERGPASRGRVFIPHPSIGVSAATGFRFSAAACQATADTWKTFLGNLNDFPGIDAPGTPQVSVVSNLGGGHHNVITKAQVGNVPDHMGSRRNRLVEARYTSATVPA